MEFTIRILVVIVLIVIVFVVLLALISGWTGQSGGLIKGMGDWLRQVLGGQSSLPSASKP